MPLTARERSSVLSEIGHALTRDVHDELLPFFAAAVSLTESLPEQVNNELRNALTHFARSLQADTKAAAQRDVEKGHGHLDRAKRDALKLSILTLHDRIQVALAEVVMRMGTVNAAFTVRRDRLTGLRQSVFLAEAQGADDTLDLLVEMYVEADTLYSDLVATYHLISKRLGRVQLFLHGVKKRTALAFWTVAGGLFVAFAAFFACAYWWPDPAALSKTMHAWNPGHASTQSVKAPPLVAPPPARSPIRERPKT
jgi:hypothetical protein